MTAPAALRHVHQVRFIDPSAPDPGVAPVLITRRVLLDGEPMQALFNGFTIRQAAYDEPVIVTFHGVPAVDVTVERTGGSDADPNWRLSWAGHDWLTPRDQAAIDAILTAQRTQASSDICITVDFAVYCGELIIGGA